MSHHFSAETVHILEKRKAYWMNQTKVYHRSESDEWFTPQPIIELVRTLLGGIDVDPASCAEANELVQAKTFYDIESNGLAHHWTGTVFLNPPYSQVAIWIEKLKKEIHTGHTTGAVLLVPARVDTRWWQTINKYTVCFIKGRLTFSGAKSGAPFPSALVNFTDEEIPFTDLCEPIGSVYRPFWR